MESVLEVWSAEGSKTATVFVQSSEVNVQAANSMTCTLRTLLGRGVKGIVVGIGRVKTLSGEAIETLNRFQEDVSTGGVRLSLFGFCGQPESLKGIKMPVFPTEEAAQKANLAQAF